MRLEGAETEPLSDPLMILSSLPSRLRTPLIFLFFLFPKHCAGASPSISAYTCGALVDASGEQALTERE